MLNDNSAEALLRAIQYHSNEELAVATPEQIVQTATLFRQFLIGENYPKDNNQ